MKISKRVLWLCLAVCCCAGLWLSAKAMANPAGSKDQQEVEYDDRTKDTSLTAFCPLYLYWQMAGQNFYVVALPGLDCSPIGLVATTDIHQIDGCNCQNPIISAPSRLMPVPKSDDAAAMTPKPDPLFSGVLR